MCTEFISQPNQASHSCSEFRGKNAMHRKERHFYVTIITSLGWRDICLCLETNPRNPKKRFSPIENIEAGCWDLRWNGSDTLSVFFGKISTIAFLSWYWKCWQDLLRLIVWKSLYKTSFDDFSLYIFGVQSEGYSHSPPEVAQHDQLYGYDDHPAFGLGIHCIFVACAWTFCSSHRCGRWRF